MPEAPETKVCAQCQTKKPIDEFGILKSSKDGHNSVCFECKRKRDRDSRAKKAKKARPPAHERTCDKRKDAEPPEKKKISQHEESAEAQLIKAFKKATIKTFVKDDLIPMIERAVEAGFE
jgi:hypothetical protein